MHSATRPRKKVYMLPFLVELRVLLVVYSVFLTSDAIFVVTSLEYNNDVTCRRAAVRFLSFPRLGTGYVRIISHG